ncbi:hypothetical protein [Mesorhizobium sp. BHbdii]
MRSLRRLIAADNMTQKENAIEFAARKRMVPVATLLGYSTALPIGMLTDGESSADLRGNDPVRPELVIMTNTMEPYESAMANATERINRTEHALERSEEMLAENIALCSRLRAQRRLIEAAHRLVEDRSPQHRRWLKA